MNRLSALFASLALVTCLSLPGVARGEESREGRRVASASFGTIRGPIASVDMHASRPVIQVEDQSGRLRRVQLDESRTLILRDDRASGLESLKEGQVVEVQLGDRDMAESVRIVGRQDRTPRAERMDRAAARADADLALESDDPEFSFRGETRFDLDGSTSLETHDPGDKLLRGIGNMGTGFLEIPRNIYNTTRDENMLSGWTIGLFKGVGYALGRTLVGVYDTITFPFAAPEGYRSIVEPEFVWEASGPDML